MNLAQVLTLLIICVRELFGGNIEFVLQVIVKNI